MIQTALELAKISIHHSEEPCPRLHLPTGQWVAKPVFHHDPFKRLITLADIFSTLKFRDWVYVQ